jgi:hypothetical protein
MRKATLPSCLGAMATFHHSNERIILQGRLPFVCGLPSLLAKGSRYISIVHVSATSFNFLSTLIHFDDCPELRIPLLYTVDIMSIQSSRTHTSALGYSAPTQQRALDPVEVHFCSNPNREDWSE